MFLKKNSFFGEEPALFYENTEEAAASAETGGIPEAARDECLPRLTITDAELEADLNALMEMNGEIGKKEVGQMLRSAGEWLKCEKFRVCVAGIQGYGKSTLIASLGRNSAFLGKNGIALFERTLPEDQDRCVCCDCLIVVLSGCALLSMDEKKALKKLNGLSPRIICAVSRMDLLRTEKDAERVRKFAASHISQIAPKAEIVYGTSFETERIRVLLEEYSASEEHILLKKSAVRTLLANTSDQMAESFQAQLRELEERRDREKAEREKKSRGLESNISRFEMELEAQFMKRCADHCKWISDRAEEKLDELRESFAMELDQTSNPKDWWEKILPYKYKVHMKALSKSLEANLNAAFQNDLKWLNAQIGREYGISVQASGLPDLSVQGNEPLKRSSSEKAGLKDIKKLKMTSRVIAGATMVLGYLFLPTAAIACGGIAAASLAGGLMSESFLNQNLEQQKAELKAELPNALGADLDNRMNRVTDSLNALYRETLGEAVDALRGFLEKEKEKLEEAGGKDCGEIGRIYGSRLETLQKINERGFKNGD